MPKSTMYGQEYTCEQGANLRQFLSSKGVQLYNEKAAINNCHGRGICATCAVGINGEFSEPTASEKFQLELSPHDGLEGGLLVAC